MAKPLKILVVEDDAFIALDLEDLLLSEGYDVIGPAPSVKTALDLIDSHGPDIALLDFNLGSDTSREIARELKQQDIPFIFLSGQVSRVVLEDEDETVLSKPYKPKRLITELERAYA